MQEFGDSQHELYKWCIDISKKIMLKSENLTEAYLNLANCFERISELMTLFGVQSQAHLF